MESEVGTVEKLLKRQKGKEKVTKMKPQKRISFKPARKVGEA